MEMELSTLTILTRLTVHHTILTILVGLLPLIRDSRVQIEIGISCFGFYFKKRWEREAMRCRCLQTLRSVPMEDSICWNCWTRSVTASGIRLVLWLHYWIIHLKPYISDMPTNMSLNWVTLKRFQPNDCYIKISILSLIHCSLIPSSHCASSDSYGSPMA